MFGWSHGQEMLSNGQKDVHKVDSAHLRLAAAMLAIGCSAELALLLCSSRIDPASH